MSEEQLKAFLEAVKADAGLQEKLSAAADADAVVAIAKAAGFVISVKELEAAVSARAGELSDEDLESVAGGGFTGATCMNASCNVPCTETEVSWCKKP
jgi:predicted ribosomally synthesized peptide with nif11-like leader